ncbi:TetR/AcrR family transcriptional regulator [Nocardia farcinica]|uniref:TetR/AcrR family transcriptional regulator n=1 Tax=Nocardia farcinica TaxID=37329 RepID=UPI000C0145A1|nr:TetR/AcrR family transcriptional regulator [Nocardia farcinica]PFX04756.1 Tetracycline repressor protein class A [Nocardia farcinica]PFX09653.1 Tetracycline repressor protein class A [Nocardia farcinica]SUE28693.1 TetR family transcriptional regulator [Nocardia farcinica]
MVKRGLTRERLVAIAHDFVAAHGIDALTMRRLAAAAEVSPGALYKHLRDRKDLQRAMADAIFTTIDLDDIDLDHPDVEQVLTCCTRLRQAMLAFRDGGRIVAGSYAPTVATARLGVTLRTLLAAVTRPPFTPGDLASVLRSYTTGFVIEEQAYLEISDSGEWDDLITALEATGLPRVDSTGDIIAIMTGDRDERFRAGLRAILAGTVRADIDSAG